MLKQFVTLSFLNIFLLINFNANDCQQLFEIQQAAQVYPASELELVQIVQNANLNQQKIALVGANKSQGGQTNLPGINTANGLRLNLSKLNQLIDLNVAQKQVTVQAGMAWRELQSIIAPHKLSVRAMQSYADFAIGGSLSVNVHGQDLLNNPIIKSVISFKLLDASGQILTVSRAQHSDLFAAVIGGYGLLGIITQVTLALTDNCLLERQTAVIKTSEFATYFDQHIKSNPNVEFYSARFDLNQEKYLDQAIIVSYHRVDSNHDCQYDLTKIYNDTVGAKILNLSAKWGMLAISDLNFFKNVRFELEKFYFKSGVKITRNRFMSFPLDSLPQDNDSHMYVLQEYFIPYPQVEYFLQLVKAVTKSMDINLLNITARHVNADCESILSYTPQDSCALVFYFKVPKKQEHYIKISNYAKALIQKAHQLGGKYYLPYQLLANKKQFLAVYPKWPEFLALKRHYDPKELFTNCLYSQYN